MKKINWIELIKNTSGKLSGSGLVGLLTATVALVCYSIGTIIAAKGNKDGLEVMTISAYLVTVAGALLGVRRFTGSAPKIEREQKEEKDETNL